MFKGFCTRIIYSHPFLSSVIMLFSFTESISVMSVDMGSEWLKIAIVKV